MESFRYLIFELNGKHDNKSDNYVTISELELYDNTNSKINYTVKGAYSSYLKKEPSYWDSTTWWSKQNFNNNDLKYTSNADGRYSSVAIELDKSSWARFYIDLGGEKIIENIHIYCGSPEMRNIMDIKVFGTNEIDEIKHIKTKSELPILTYLKPEDINYVKKYLLKPKKMYKYLVEKKGEYYSFNTREIIKLGTPSYDEQLEQWYEEFGEEDINILFENINSKFIDLYKKSEVYESNTEMDFNKIDNDVIFKVLDINSKQKRIEYTLKESFMLLNDFFNVLENDFNICQYKKKERME